MVGELWRMLTDGLTDAILSIMVAGKNKLVALGKSIDVLGPKDSLTYSLSLESKMVNQALINFTNSYFFD